MDLVSSEDLTVKYYTLELRNNELNTSHLSVELVLSVTMPATLMLTEAYECWSLESSGLPVPRILSLTLLVYIIFVSIGSWELFRYGWIFVQEFFERCDWYNRETVFVGWNLIVMPSIGFQDFIPDKTVRSKDNRGYELHSDVMERAGRWIARQQGVRFTNVQTVPIKIKKRMYLANLILWSFQVVACVWKRVTKFDWHSL